MRCSSGSAASASLRHWRRADPTCSSTGSLIRTSSTGIWRRARMWSRAALRATRVIQAANGTERSSYLRIALISFAKMSWVMSCASWGSRTMLCT